MRSYLPKCILLKLDFAKFGVSNFLQKLSRKTFGESARPPPRLVKEQLTLFDMVGIMAPQHVFDHLLKRVGGGS